MTLDAIGKWLGIALLVGFAGLVYVEIQRYFETALLSPIESEAVPERPTDLRRVLIEVLLAYVLSRLLVALTCAVVYCRQAGTLESFLPAFISKLLPWDAPHYLGIIENGYVTEGDPRLHLVFFPFYPMVCRTLAFATGLSAFASAMVVSNLALIGAGACMYRLAELDGGPEVGRRAMLLMMFCPMTYFFAIPYTESTFLLVTLLSVYMARKRRFGLALLFGAMAANTRMPGMATAIPIFWELLRADTERAAEAGITNAPGVLFRRILKCALKTLPVAAGLVLYLCINYSLYGNPTQFLIYQRENWFQSLGTLAGTFRTSFVNSFDYEDHLYQLGVWRPQTILMIAVPLLFWLRRRRERSGDMGYALVYHWVAFSPTWLLSGPRYTAANYALYPLLARIPKRRWQFALMLAVECALLAYMTWLGLWHSKVY